MTRYVLKSLLIVLLCGCATAFSAARDTRAVVATRGDSALDIRLQKLESELRCLVCQNQTLADSNAGLAVDLRREVRDLAEQGRTDVDIKQYLVSRYGDFVLYKPPVKQTTWLLWFGPFVLLIACVLSVLVWRRRVMRIAVPVVEPDESIRKRAEALLS